MWIRAWNTWPIFPARASCRAVTTDGFHAIGQLTMSRVRWRRAAACIRRAPSAVAAIGFSTIAWSPRAAAASTIGTPPALESQTRTPSASTSSKRSPGFSYRAVTPNSFRSFPRRGLFGSAPPTILTPGTAANWGRSFQAWSWMRPATTSRKGFMAAHSTSGPAVVRGFEESGLRPADGEPVALGLDPVGGQRQLRRPVEDPPVRAELRAVARAVQPVLRRVVVDLRAAVRADDRRRPVALRGAPHQHRVRDSRESDLDLVPRILQAVTGRDRSTRVGVQFGDGVDRGAAPEVKGEGAPGDEFASAQRHRATSLAKASRKRTPAPARSGNPDRRRAAVPGR